MENLEINQITTLKAPNTVGECLLVRNTGFCCQCTEYVSFEKLAAWVASIQEQIITVATDTKPYCFFCDQARDLKRNLCPDCGKALSR